MREDHEIAIKVVKDHLSWMRKHTVSTYFENQFAQMSYSKSALNDILRLLMHDPETPASILIEEYADKMDEYSCVNASTSIIFSVAHDIALAVLWDLHDKRGER